MRSNLTIVFLSFFLCYANTSIAQLSSVGLVANWKFSGNVQDSSGNNNHGIISGTLVPTVGKKGKTGTAMAFAGNGNYVFVPYSPGFNFTKYSICVILKHIEFFTGPCQGNAIIVRGPAAPGHWGINVNDNAYNSCSIADTNLYIFTAYTGPAGPSGTALQYTPSTHTNTWYCVIATYDSLNTRIYIDGQLKVTYPFVTPVGSSTDGIGIGADLFPGPMGFPFTGVIDDIRVYNRVLDSNEIKFYCNNSGDEEIGDNITEINNNSLKLNLYPNPVHDIVTLNVESPNKLAVQYGIYNAMGQTITNGSFMTSTQVNVSTWPKGIYYIRLYNNDGNVTKQFIVE
jgi:hypothetical protein